MPHSTTYAPSLPRVPERGCRSEAGSPTVVVRPAMPVMRLGQLFAFVGPLLLAIGSIVRWQAGGLSASAVTAVLVAALMVVLVAAPGVSRANRR